MATVDGQPYSCKCYKDDSCWPSTSEWESLRTAVAGNIYSVQPAGSVCYNNFNGTRTYNVQECSAATANWANATWVTEDLVSPQWPFYSNNTCDPRPNASNSTCTLGYLPEIVIKARTKAHIQAGVNFARDHNLRLVIRNTGHDFMGRSTGYGALAINTNSFDSIQFNEDSVTIGAGVLHNELYKAAFEQEPKRVVVGGECPTVGISGGYIQGGGHGPMAGFYGLAADNALSFDVVTADGNFVTANADENPDLFWALKGGGPSTFGVVVSSTLRTFPEVHSTGMYHKPRTNQRMSNGSSGMRLNIAGTGDTFWKGVADFHNMANVYTDAGMYVWFSISPVPSLTVRPFVAPNKTKAEFEEIINPLLDQLTADNVTFTYEIKEWPTFYELYQGMWSFAHDAGANQALVGGRLFTASDVETHGDDIVKAFRFVSENAGAVIGGHILNPGHAKPTVDNAVHPAWRRAASADLYILPVSATPSLAERRKAEDMVTNVLGQAWRDASPDGASYVNEGDVNEPEWQEVYWGSNYPKLLEVKKKWDPQNVFYAKSTPGTEGWTEILDGKLCKKTDSNILVRPE
ncbi:FAD-binding domain-containing protein [Patellaria atrata CBS 101060]|uniref:FAD-binding domain-containing protein n=1 Tax=Patellaria atrata CBS 101060 TaxID=1346257 RepID=A0A9P4S9B9_9PEZI|nr:FAD-binding domain-containing protein [Patellaria atrata CBS 101060]